MTKSYTRPLFAALFHVLMFEPPFPLHDSEVHIYNKCSFLLYVRTHYEAVIVLSGSFSLDRTLEK